jgi:hypothetical protein
MLRDAQKRTTRAIHRLPRSGPIASGPNRVRAAWQALVAAARRGADRVVQARSAQAEAYIARTAATLAASPRRPRADDIVRYY